jgi:hypothetical protein
MLLLTATLAVTQRAGAQDESTRQFKVRVEAGNHNSNTLTFRSQHHATLSIAANTLSVDRKVCGNDSGMFPLEAITGYSMEQDSFTAWGSQPYLLITIRSPAGSPRLCRISIFGETLNNGMSETPDPNSLRYLQAIKELLDERIRNPLRSTNPNVLPNNQGPTSKNETVREFDLTEEAIQGGFMIRRHPLRLSVTQDSLSADRPICGTDLKSIPLEAIKQMDMLPSCPKVQRVPCLRITVGRPEGPHQPCTIIEFNNGPAGIDQLRTIMYFLQERAESRLLALQQEAARIDEERRQKEAQEKALRDAQPAGLVILAQFDDSHSLLPDNRMDASKKADLVVTVQNQGPGPAFGVVLEVSGDQPQVALPEPQELGDLSPGQSRELRLPIQAGLDLPSGALNILLAAHEKRGYDAQKVNLVVTTAALERPSLSIASYVINDGTTGRAHGNGNRIPENGETIELQVFVKNSGTGVAAAPELKLSNVDSGIEVLQSSDTLGSIQPNSTAEGKLVFTIPRTYSGKGLKVTLQAVDGRGPAVAAVSQDFNLPFSVRAPVLTSTARVLAIDENTKQVAEVKDLANGDTAELEVRLDNTGTMDAEDVALHVSAAGAAFQRDQVPMGALSAGEKEPPQRLRFRIPRSYAGSALPIVISATQKDFPPASSLLVIPIRHRHPDLDATRFGIGAEETQAIRQNERGDLVLQIANSGSLGAEGVETRIEVTTPGVEIEGPKVALIGQLPPNGQREARFHLRVRGGAPAGDLPVQLVISQADFPARTETLHLNIAAEKPTQEIVRPTVVTAQPSLQPQRPVITVVSPHNGDYVRGASLDLIGTLLDQKGIKLITISVNQKSVPEESIRKGLSRRDTETESGRDVADLSIPLALDSGDNKIVVTAYNLQNESEKTELTVKRLEDRPEESGGQIPLVAQADVDQYVLGLKPGTPNPRRWAVIIGIERYRKAPEVRFAERDAYAMREYASRLLDVPADHMVLMINDKATKNELLELLEDRLVQEVKPGDTLYVFFAGHGTVAASRDASVGASYLLPSDADPQSPRITGYSLRDFYDDLGKLQAQKVVVFLDACFSGLSARGERSESLVPGTRGAYLEVPAPELPPNLVSISAASSKQVSNAYNQEAHGLFTYFLLKGFSGDAWKGNKLLLSDLANYVRSNVSESARRLFGESLQQTPAVSPGVSPDHDVVLVEK